MQMVDGITNIKLNGPRDGNNLPAEDQVPPVLTHELVKLKGRDFPRIVISHLPRLKQFWSDEMIIELQYRELLLSYRINITPSYDQKIDKCDHILHHINLAGLL